MRSAEGKVPRQNWRIGCGPLAMERMVERRVVWWDCCTRVLRRSAGWRRTADRMPDPRPAKKWKEDDERDLPPSDIALLSCKLIVMSNDRSGDLAWCGLRRM